MLAALILICASSGIKETIITDCNKSGVWKILLLDPFTTKLLSTCCKMSDLMAEKITIVEDLYKIREPVPEMKAIYFMTPTSKSVDAFISDFKTKAKYKAAYVYFTDYCSDDLFNKMKLYCAKHIRVCKELNISFMPQEAQVFTCDNPEAFYSIYSPHSSDKRKTLETLAEQLVTLCATLDEYPGVRYKRDGNMENAKTLAEMVDTRLARHYELDDSGKKKTQAQLLIVERGFDPVSPILHELTYQAMAYDLTPIKNDIYTYKSKDVHRSGCGRIKTVHLQLAEDCMKAFSDNVEKICKAEQDLAVGSDADGMKVKDPMRTLLPVLLHPYSKYDKIRAVLLYIFSLNGTTDENLSKLIQHVKIEDEREFIQNWKELGVPIITSSFSISRKVPRRDHSQEERYNLSRWIPVIKDVMENTRFPACALKSHPSWSLLHSARQKHKPSSQDERRSGSRLIIFIIGGIAYSEMRSAYEVTQAVKSCEVIIGSSHILTPTGLLDDIKALSKRPMESFSIEERSNA
uniref:Syntaxin binding protein 3 n=1 Tax=Nothobranchius furzeri TaxID=105023 RepID=A0A8C6VVC7_NOTFU